jgi:DNA polymerase-4
MEKYKAESLRIMQILVRTGAKVEPMSIDEAYLELGHIVATPALDLSQHKASTEEITEAQDRALYSALPLARDLKRQIFSECELTATIGIASNKLLAKLASDFQKPDGLTLIPERDKIEFLRPLSVRSLHGVGKVTEQVLRGAGVETVGDLQDYPGDLRAIIGSFGVTLRAYAVGQDERPLELDESIKSISSEETFLKDTEDRPLLKRSLMTQANDVADKLQRKQMAARTVQVKLRYGDFTTLTRQITVEEALADPKEIYRLACFLLAKERLVSRPLRLLGLGVSHLTSPPVRQLHLW